MSNFVLKGDICYSVSPTQLAENKDSFVVCKGGRSCGVFQSLPKEFQDLPLHDYGNRLIFPGMIDLHIHAPQYAFRGLGMDMELLDWLESRAFPEEIKYRDLNYARSAYTVFVQNLKKSATTRACIFATLHRRATEILMDLMESSGLISYVGKVNMDRNSPDELCEASAEQSEQETRTWLREIDGTYQRTMPILTPRFIPSCSDDLLNRLKTVQKEYQLPIQSHLSENPSEQKWVESLCPDAKFYGDAYDRYDLFGRSGKTIMAHCVYSTEDEVERMAENGVFVAHCPTSNLNLSSGIAPIRKYCEKGLKIGLGSDVAGGHTESIFNTIVDAIQVSKLYWRLVDPTCKPMTFDEVFYLATKGGGEFFGKVGSFEEGYSFDAVILNDAQSPDLLQNSLHDRLERAVYQLMDRTSIEAKYAAGEKIF